MGWIWGFHWHAYDIRLMRFSFFVFYFTISIGINAQYDNFRIQNQKCFGDTTYIDSLSIIPGSLSVKDSSGNVVSSMDYIINYPKASIYFRDQTSIGQTYTFEYRVFPYLFDQKFLDS